MTIYMYPHKYVYKFRELALLLCSGYWSPLSFLFWGLVGTEFRRNVSVIINI
jgi:hypothetical protein